MAEIKDKRQSTSHQHVFLHLIYSVLCGIVSISSFSQQHLSRPQLPTQKAKPIY